MFAEDPVFRKVSSDPPPRERARKRERERLRAIRFFRSRARIPFSHDHRQSRWLEIVNRSKRLLQQSF